MCVYFDAVHMEIYIFRLARVRAYRTVHDHVWFGGNKPSIHAVEHEHILDPRSVFPPAAAADNQTQLHGKEHTLAAGRGYTASYSLGGTSD